jgi:hypothetical protein
LRRRTTFPLDARQYGVGKGGLARGARTADEAPGDRLQAVTPGYLCDREIDRHENRVTSLTFVVPKMQRFASPGAA